MANAHHKRPGRPEDVADTDVRSSPPGSREQADGAATPREREVPVAAGSEMQREPSSAAPSFGATSATSPPTSEPLPAHAAQQPSVAERIEVTFGRWGEQVGSTMASARRTARERTRALTASGHTSREAAGAPSSGETSQAAQATERWPDSPTLQRAELAVNRMTGRIQPLASVIGQRVQRLVARAREEAEDIWAEAESMRARGASRGDQDTRTPQG
jgi:hypothetical protein